MARTRALAGILVLALFGAWAHHTNPYATLPEILAAPDTFDGRHVEGFGEATVSRAVPGGFVLVSKGVELHVLADAPVAAPGTYVAVAGTFRAPNRLEARAVHFARGRRIKMAVSLLPLGVLLVLGPWFLEIDPTARALGLRRSRRA